MAWLWIVKKLFLGVAMTQDLFSAKDVDADMGKLDTVIEDLKQATTYRVDLQDEDKEGLVMFGTKALNFTQAALDSMGEVETLVSGFLDVEELKADVKFCQDFGPKIKKLERLLDQLKDTYSAAGSDAYAASLTYYNTIKAASRAKLPGTEAIYKELKKYFTGGRKKS